MSFIAQDFDSLTILAILDGRTQATIRNHFLRYSRQVRNRVKVITMDDIFSAYYDIAKKLFPNAKFVLYRFSYRPTSEPGHESSTCPDYESV
ncbi:Transposase, IS204/IS1001/IS1096/IS1165 [Streptococcus infantarius subsp. infantarius]|nr:Transposase, IS204/IS1001/IS1096/IS1165 [Streptococcus infantarius subsp. infantarius]MCO4524642.1 Transposase, IS204/IS1001/IS1096/IS1165 [Streptococcus infantarius subsp. infantarius]